MRVSFMIIGAMKCGTSTLANALANHPEVCFSRPKEPNFFNLHKDWKAGIPVYHDLFLHKHARLYGEGSTGYTKFPKGTRPDLCDVLYEYNPNLKFIYLVRHPVERAISQYMHIYQRRFINSGFPVALRKSSIMDIGNYILQIEPYIRKFGRDQLLILKFEQMIREQDRIFQKTAGFLGIDPSCLTGLGRVSKNASIGKSVMTIQQEKFFRKNITPLHPYLPKPLFYWIKQQFIRYNHKRSFKERIKISEEDERYILERSRPGILKLQELVDFDLSDYLVPSGKG